MIDIQLEANNRELNVHRYYQILAQKDLLGMYSVTLLYGRKGGFKGRKRYHGFNTIQEAQTFIHKTLKRRLSAPKRIGCSYHLKKAFYQEELPCLGANPKFLALLDQFSPKATNKPS